MPETPPNPNPPAPTQAALSRRVERVGLACGAAGLAGGLGVALLPMPWAVLSVVLTASAATVWLHRRAARLAAPVAALADALEAAADNPRDADRHEPCAPDPRIDTDPDAARARDAAHRLAAAAGRDARHALSIQRALEDRVDRAKAAALNHLDHIANRDALTGLGNRRHLDRELPELVRAALGSRSRLVAVALDVDLLKRVNDTLGHAAGDTLLTLLADLIRASVRHDDLAVRLGGDEFVLLLPGCTVDRALEVLDNLRKRFTHEARIRFSSMPQTPDVSAGVVTLDPAQHANGAALLRDADAALYTAKRAGRGRTVTHGTDRAA